ATAGGTQWWLEVAVRLAGVGRRHRGRLLVDRKGAVGEGHRVVVEEPRAVVTDRRRDVVRGRTGALTRCAARAEGDLRGAEVAGHEATVGRPQRRLGGAVRLARSEERSCGGRVAAW